MLRICHIADVHIRGLSRHDEIRTVFTELAEQCKKQVVDHIFVGGDTFHTKTQGISPEVIDLLSWWFKTLASIAPVHIILGNHDCNLVNPSRQDAISPIVSALNDSRVHLYKHSGVFQFAPGYNWCIYSLLDEENWPNVKPVPGDVNIACFHGAVWGAKTETDWEIEEGMKVDFFKEYDFVFLGDIHKFQYLDYRDVELVIDEKDLDKYPNAEVIEVISE